MTDTVDRASGTVLGSVLLTLFRGGGFYQQSIEFLQPGRYGLRFTLVAPQINHRHGSDNDSESESCSDIIVGKISNEEIGKEQAQQEATEMNVHPSMPMTIDSATDLGGTPCSPRDSNENSKQCHGDLAIPRGNRRSSRLSKKRAVKPTCKATLSQPPRKRVRVKGVRLDCLPTYEPIVADQPDEIIERMHSTHMQPVSESIWHSVVVKLASSSKTGPFARVAKTRSN